MSELHDDTVKLEVENSKLKLQLEKVFEAIGQADCIFTCPSSVGLVESDICPQTPCQDCWRNALSQI